MRDPISIKIQSILNLNLKQIRRKLRFKILISAWEVYEKFKIDNTKTQMYINHTYTYPYLFILLFFYVFSRNLGKEPTDHSGLWNLDWK